MKNDWGFLVGEMVNEPDAGFDFIYLDKMTPTVNVWESVDWKISKTTATGPDLLYVDEPPAHLPTGSQIRHLGP